MNSLQITNLVLIQTNQYLLNHISLAVKKGSITGLLGKSGSGKSTLLKTVLAYSPAYLDYSGEILVGGEFLNPSRRNKLQPVFQDPLVHFNPSWTLKQCLFEPLYINFKLSEEEMTSRAVQYLQELNFNDMSVLEKNILKFSGGELQRFAIIRALLCQPELLLMDEPVSALDVNVQNDLIALIRNLVKNHQLSVLFISHDLDIVRELCDYIYIIDSGSIVEEGKAEQIFLEPASTVTRMLLDSRNLEDIRNRQISS